MDIVYVVGKSENDYYDLKYSLRSLKHLKEYDNVWIIGKKPYWIKNVIHIPCSDDKGDKQLNVISKIFLACCYPNLTDNFILMNDDFYFLEDTYLIKNYSTGTFEDKIKFYSTRHPNSSYTKSLRNGLKNMQNLGLTEFHDFEVHYPIVYNKQNFRNLFKRINKSISTIHRSIYANYFKYKPELTEDFKIYTEFPEEYKKEFLSTDNEVINTEKFRKFINSKFPEKSKYEI